jgi:hypothetical protein
VGALSQKNSTPRTTTAHIAQELPRKPSQLDLEMAPNPLTKPSKKPTKPKNAEPKPSSSQTQQKPSKPEPTRKKKTKKQTQKVEPVLTRSSPPQAQEDSSSESEEDIEEGPFPELFLSDDDGEEIHVNGSKKDAIEEPEDEDEDEDEDDESLDVSDEVDDEELGSLLDDSNSETSNDPSTDNLDNVIARSSFKPDEDDSEVIDPSFSMLGRKTDYMSRAISKPSAFVKGAKINVWDEIEPGYGSESSTEDVSSQI